MQAIKAQVMTMLRVISCLKKTPKTNRASITPTDVNKPKNEFRNRLKNLAKIIKNNKKDLNEEEEKEELKIKGKT